jgi:flagellar basal body rod protein FlgC
MSFKNISEIAGSAMAAQSVRLNTKPTAPASQCSPPS